MRILGFTAGICLVLVLTGCSSKSEPPQPVLAPDLPAYSTRTPIIIPTVNIPTAQILTLTPTPTPHIYQVVLNDTLTGIARRFGISLDSLQAANPDVSASALKVGQSLTIPSASQGAGPVSPSTPVPLDLNPGTCQPSGGGTVCYVPVHNPYPDALENVSLLVTLFDEHGQALASQQAVLPLDILPADQVLPASVFFSGQTSSMPPGVQLLTSIRLSPGDPRYLPTSIQNLLVSTAWDGLSANLQGRIFLPEGAKPASRLWLVGVAFDASGQLVGFRRWEWSGTLQPGATQPFTLDVYSLGPAIQHVNVLVEARP